MHLTFNYTDHHIEVSLPDTSLDVQDLLNHIRDEEASERGIAYDAIGRASGREDLGNSVKVGLTLELLGWQVHFQDGDYIARCYGGNLVGGISNDPIAYSPGVQTLLIQSAASTVVEITSDGTGGTGGGLTQAQNDRLFATALQSTANEIKTRVFQNATQASLDELRGIIDALQNLVTSVEATVGELHDEAFGRWVLDFENDRLTLYRPDSTVLKTFALTRTLLKTPAYNERIPV